MPFLYTDARRFLAAHPPRVVECGERAGDDACRKAAILPFLRAATTENWRFLVMKPQARHPQLGPPPFQLCKGTRMGGETEDEREWRDIRPEALLPIHVEPLALTALREGWEELGLPIAGEMRLYDLGRHGFSSASTKNSVFLWLFAAEMPGSPVLHKAAETTADRAWLRADEFTQAGRADHAPILNRAAESLAGIANIL